MKISVESVILHLLLGAACCLGQVPADLEARVDGMLERWASTTTPGAAVAIVKGGSVLLKKGYGMANLEEGVPIKTATVFDIASVSKQFAGLAIAMLVGEGKIDLEADIRKYLPWVPDFGEKIAVGHLVHHTSGLRDWPGALVAGGYRVDDVISFDQILDMVRRQRDLNFPPGTRYSYSNTGYNLLAALVSKVTGTAYPAWMKRKVFEPLGMEDTVSPSHPGRVIKGRATSYAPLPFGRFRARRNGLTAHASSSLHTTIDDLIRWVQNFDTGHIGGRAALELMHRRGRLRDSRTIDYAFGVNVVERFGKRVVAHSGSWAGFRTCIARVPELQLSAIVLGNVTSIPAAGLANRMLMLFADGKGLEAISSPAADEPAFDVPEAVRRRLVGAYMLRGDWWLEITEKDGHLMVQATEERRVPMTALSETRFFVPAYRSGLEFRLGESGPASSVEYRGMSAPRGTPRPRAPEELDHMTGRYSSRELDAWYTVSRIEGGLRLKHIRKKAVTLRSIHEDSFRGSSWWCQQVRFHRDDGGNVTGFSISQGRNQDMRFDRVPDAP